MTNLMAFVRRRARAPAALALTDQLVVSGCNFGSAVIVARELPTHDFGLFSLAAMCCLFLSNLHRAALTQPMNVLGASDTPDQIGRRLAGLLRLHGLIVPLAAAALLLAAWLLFPDAGIVLAAIVYFTCFALQETLRRYWYTRVAIREALVNDVLSYGGQLAALLVLAGVDGLSGASALSAMAATSLLAFAIGAAQVGAVAFRPARSMRALIDEHWPMAKWLVLTVLAVWGAGQAYPLLLSPLGTTAVASFVACRTLLNVMAPLVQSVGNYIPAHAAATLRTQGLALFRWQLWRTCVAALAVGAAFLLLVHWLAEPLLHLVYNGRYDHAAPLLRVLACVTIFSLLSAILGAYALAMADSRSNFFSNLGASAVTFTAGLWLIGTQGVWGAALGAVLTGATAMTLQGGFVVARLHRMRAMQ